MKRFLTTLAAASFAATGAHAVTFNLTTAGFAADRSGGCDNIPGGTDGGFSACEGQQYTVGGIVLDVTAGLYTDTAITGNAVVTEGQRDAEPRVFDAGTGVDHDGGAGLPNDDDHQVDGDQGNEVVFLRFSETVQLISAMFSFVGGNDDYDLFIELGATDNLLRIGQDIDIPEPSDMADFTSLLLFGDLFGIGASGANDEWKLKSITVAEAPEIPLPAAFPLFLAGIAGLTFARRAKKKA